MVGNPVGDNFMNPEIKLLIYYKKSTFFKGLKLREPFCSRTFNKLGQYSEMWVFVSFSCLSKLYFISKLDIVADPHLAPDYPLCKVLQNQTITITQKVCFVDSRNLAKWMALDCERKKWAKENYRERVYKPAPNNLNLCSVYK